MLMRALQKGGLQRPDSLVEQLHAMLALFVAEALRPTTMTDGELLALNHLSSAVASHRRDATLRHQLMIAAAA